MEVYSSCFRLVNPLTSCISLCVHLPFVPFFHSSCYLFNVSTLISFSTSSFSCSFLQLYLSALSHVRKWTGNIPPITNTAAVDTLLFVKTVLIVVVYCGLHKVTTFWLNNRDLASIGDSYNSLLTTTVDSNFRFPFPEPPTL